MWLLDTNTVIYFFKGQGEVADTLLNKAPRDIFISSVSLFELLVGAEKSVSSHWVRQQIDQFIASVQVIAFSEREAQAAASIRAALERAGTPVGPMDTQIAGTAAAHGLTVVTRNVVEFQRVPGLSVENWY